MRKQVTPSAEINESLGAQVKKAYPSVVTFPLPTLWFQTCRATTYCLSDYSRCTCTFLMVFTGISQGRIGRRLRSRNGGAAMLTCNAQMRELFIKQPPQAKSMRSQLDDIVFVLGGQHAFPELCQWRTMGLTLPCNSLTKRCQRDVFWVVVELGKIVACSARSIHRCCGS